MSARSSIERADYSANEGSGDSSPTTYPTTSKKATNNECVTSFDPVVLTQKWTVNNFDSLLKLSRPGVCLRSQVFKDASHPDSCWQLCLYPGGKREENANNVSLFLKMSATSQQKEVIVKAEYRFYFLGDNEEAKFSNVNIGEFHAKPPKGGHSWGLRNIPRQKVQNSIRSDKSLVISCNIELIPDPNRILCKRMPMCMKLQRNLAEVPFRFLESELSMLRSGEGSDITIVSRFQTDVGEEVKTFRVHSYKLKTHSEVFRAMLSNDYLESQSGEIVIRDCPVYSVRVMLEFIYTGTILCPMNVDEAAEVMFIADKYAVMELRCSAEQALLDSISHDNVFECFLFGEKFDSRSIQEACIEYMASTKSKVMGSPAWRPFTEMHPNLANRVLERMIAVSDTPPVKKQRT